MGFARTAFVLAVVLGICANARTITDEERASDFEQLGSMLHSHYGPYDYKKNLFKIDLEALVKKYSDESKGLTNLEFYHQINKFVAEFHDSHFRTQAKVNHVSMLGFIADRIQGKVLLDRIDRSLLPESGFPFERGDEILEINGKPVADTVAEIAKYLPMGYDESALRMASVLVGIRPAALVAPQSGFVKLKIRHGTSKLTDTAVLRWLSMGDLDGDDEQQEWSTPTGPTLADYSNLSIDDIFANIPKGESNFRCSGITRTAIPRDATILMTAPFVAYYHPTPKGNVGYLRIPHYSWGASEDVRFQQYEYAVDELEKNTVGLVIDQDHNCGGSVFYLEKMVSLFADKPFQGLQFQFLATRSEYLDFKSSVDAEASSTLSGRDWMGVVELMKTTWKSRARMTPKISFHNNRLLNVNPIHYTKPVLMLIDEMSGSGGDAFPAIMQGIGRAKLMGVRTMGAGGHVVMMPSLNNSSNVISMTKSLFYRPDGVAVENNGAVPDIQYLPSREDFLYDYREYQERYLEELAKLIP